MCEHLVNVGNFWMKQNHTVLSDQLQYWNRSPIFPGSWHYLFELASEAMYSLVLKMCFPTVIVSRQYMQSSTFKDYYECFMVL